MSRKKVLKLIALVAVAHTVYTSNSSSSNKILHREMSSSYNKDVPLELIQAVQQAALKDHLVSKKSVPGADEGRMMLTKSDEVPLLPEALDNAKALGRGTWREFDGTNTSHDDEAKLRAMMEGNEDVENTDLEDENTDRGIIGSLFGGKKKTVDLKNLAPESGGTKNIMGEGVFDIRSHRVPDKDEPESSPVNTRGEYQQDMWERIRGSGNSENIKGMKKVADIMYKPTAGGDEDEINEDAINQSKKMLRGGVDPESLKNMNSDELNDLMDKMGINPDVLPGGGSKGMKMKKKPTEFDLLKEKADKKKMGGDMLSKKSGKGGDLLSSLGSMGAEKEPMQLEILRKTSAIEDNPQLAALLTQYSEEDIASILSQMTGTSVEHEPEPEPLPKSLPSLGSLSTSLPSAKAPKPLLAKAEEPSLADLMRAHKNKTPLTPKQCSSAPEIGPPKTEPMVPTMIASYPGSGARLGWKLIRPITGYMTSDDAVDQDDLAKKGVVIAIKSHYPAHGSNDELFEPFAEVPRSVLLIRNPIKCIPSFLSYLYERENNLDNHSTRVPLDEWVAWRDANFEKELQSWVHHTLFWMEHNAPEDQIVVAFEDLTSEETGPNEYLRLGEFLSETSGKALAHPPSEIPCLWDYVVHNRGDQSITGLQPKSQREGPKMYPFTDEQTEAIVHYLKSLGELYPEKLGAIMDNYIRAVFDLRDKVIASGLS
jgi:hypothetical protein